MVESKYVSGRDGASRGSYTLVTDAGAEIKTAYEAEANAYTDTKNTKLAGIATGATIATKEFFVPVTYANGGSMGLISDYPGLYSSGGAYGAASFNIPNDFTSIVSAVLLIIPTVSNALGNIDIWSDYAASGENYQTHSESNTGSSYNLTANELYSIDLSGILSSIAAGDNVGIRSRDSGNVPKPYLIGVRFRYA